MNQNTPGNSMVRQAVPFFMVSHMQASLEFYINGLGFELKNKWERGGTIEWCWLQKDQASIMLQEYRENAPLEKRGVGVSVCFMCDDALSIYQKAVSNGLNPTEPFVGNNLWVVEFRDPDDYAILFESPTEVAEETKYTDWKKSK